MAVELDPHPDFQDFAEPGRLVSTEWLAENLGRDGLVVVESDEDVLLYETGHIPGAVKVDWHTELNQGVLRDYLDGEGFAELMRKKGIKRTDTVVFYGDKNNWWAAYALWVFTLFGHEDLRILDGGRKKWEDEGREYTKEPANRPETEYPVIERDDRTYRAFRFDVAKHFGKPILDIRSPEEYSGERTSAPAYPEEGALRAGHIPSAVNVPWGRAVNEETGAYKTRAELEALYQGEVGLDPKEPTIAYCRIGERSSHSWFALKYLLGFEDVRNYDGSWTEWGSLVGAPIVKSSEPGEAPAPISSY